MLKTTKFPLASMVLEYWSWLDYHTKHAGRLSPGVDEHTRKQIYKLGKRVTEELDIRVKLGHA